MSAHNFDSATGSDSSARGPDLIAGQKLALAGASLALGVCSFISLLGMEKAILAIVFGLLAMRNGSGRPATRLAWARFGVILGVLQIVLVLGLLIAFREQVMRFFEFMERFEAAG